MVDKQIEYLKKLIEEVKKEASEKKVLVESKTPQDVFEKHKQNIKDYVSQKVFETIKNSEN